MCMQIIFCGKYKLHDLAIIPKAILHRQMQLKIHNRDKNRTDYLICFPLGVNKSRGGDRRRIVISSMSSRRGPAGRTLGHLLRRTPHKIRNNYGIDF